MRRPSKPRLALKIWVIQHINERKRHRILFNQNPTLESIILEVVAIGSLSIGWIFLHYVVQGLVEQYISLSTCTKSGRSVSYYQVLSSNWLFFDISLSSAAKLRGLTMEGSFKIVTVVGFIFWNPEAGIAFRTSRYTSGCFDSFTLSTVRPSRAQMEKSKWMCVDCLDQDVTVSIIWIREYRSSEYTNRQGFKTLLTRTHFWSHTVCR